MRMNRQWFVHTNRNLRLANQNDMVRLTHRIRKALKKRPK